MLTIYVVVWVLRGGLVASLSADLMRKVVQDKEDSQLPHVYHHLRKLIEVPFMLRSGNTARPYMLISKGKHFSSLWLGLDLWRTELYVRLQSSKYKSKL